MPVSDTKPVDHGSATLKDYPMQWALNKYIVLPNNRRYRVNYFKLAKNSGYFYHKIMSFTEFNMYSNWISENLQPSLNKNKPNDKPNQLQTYNRSNNMLFLNPINLDDFEMALRFCHFEKIVLDSGNIHRALHCCYIYQLKGLIELCSQYLTANLSSSNVFDYRNALLEAPIPVCNNELYKIIQKFLVYNIVPCSLSDHFRLISADFLQEILMNDELNVDNEQIVLFLIHRWASFVWTERIDRVVDLVATVRFVTQLTVQQMRQIDTSKHHQQQDLLIQLCFASNGNSTEYWNHICNVYDQLHHNTIKLQRCHDNVPTNQNTDERNVALTVSLSRQPRYPHEMIFVFGGFESEQVSRKVHIYDDKCNTWWSYEDPNKYQFVLPHTLMSFGIAYSQKRACIYFVGGEIYQCEATQQLLLYDLKDSRWTHKSPMHDVRRDLATVLVDDEFLYAIGGDNNRLVLQSMEKFLPDRNQWIRVQPMLMRRSGLAAQHIQGKIYVCGGYTMVPMNELTNTCEAYDIATNQWTYMPPMTQLRYYFQSLQHQSNLYVLGGGDENFYTTVECYDIAKNVWTPMPPLKSQRADFAACIFKDEFVCIGGGSDFQSTADVERWNPRMKSNKDWAYMESLPSKIWGHRAVTVKGIEFAKKYLKDCGGRRPDGGRPYMQYK